MSVWDFNCPTYYDFARPQGWALRDDYFDPHRLESGDLAWDDADDAAFQAEVAAAMAATVLAEGVVTPFDAPVDVVAPGTVLPVARPAASAETTRAKASAPLHTPFCDVPAAHPSVTSTSLQTDMGGHTSVPARLPTAAVATAATALPPLPPPCAVVRHVSPAKQRTLPRTPRQQQQEQAGFLAVPASVLPSVPPVVPDVPVSVPPRPATGARRTPSAQRGRTPTKSNTPGRTLPTTPRSAGRVASCVVHHSPQVDDEAAASRGENRGARLLTSGASSGPRSSTRAPFSASPSPAHCVAPACNTPSGIVLAEQCNARGPVTPRGGLVLRELKTGNSPTAPAVPGTPTSSGVRDTRARAQVEAEVSPSAWSARSNLQTPPSRRTRRISGISSDAVSGVLSSISTSLTKLVSSLATGSTPASPAGSWRSEGLADADVDAFVAPTPAAMLCAPSRAACPANVSASQERTLPTPAHIPTPHEPMPGHAYGSVREAGMPLGADTLDVDVTRTVEGGEADVDTSIVTFHERHASVAAVAAAQSTRTSVHSLGARIATQAACATPGDLGSSVIASAFSQLRVDTSGRAPVLPVSVTMPTPTPVAARTMRAQSCGAALSTLDLYMSPASSSGILSPMPVAGAAAALRRSISTGSHTESEMRAAHTTHTMATSTPRVAAAQQSLVADLRSPLAAPSASGRKAGAFRNFSRASDAHLLPPFSLASPMAACHSVMHPNTAHYAAATPRAAPAVLEIDAARGTPGVRARTPAPVHMPPASPLTCALRHPSPARASVGGQQCTQLVPHDSGTVSDHGAHVDAVLRSLSPTVPSVTLSHAPTQPAPGVAPGTAPCSMRSTSRTARLATHAPAAGQVGAGVSVSAAKVTGTAARVPTRAASASAHAAAVPQPMTVHPPSVPRMLRTASASDVVGAPPAADAATSRTAAYFRARAMAAARRHAPAHVTPTHTPADGPLKSSGSRVPPPCAARNEPSARGGVNAGDTSAPSSAGPAATAAASPAPARRIVGPPSAVRRARSANPPTVPVGTECGGGGAGPAHATPTVSSNAAPLLPFSALRAASASRARSVSRTQRTTAKDVPNAATVPVAPLLAPSESTEAAVTRRAASTSRLHARLSAPPGVSTLADVQFSEPTEEHVVAAPAVRGRTTQPAPFKLHTEERATHWKQRAVAGVAWGVDVEHDVTHVHAPSHGHEHGVGGAAHMGAVPPHHRPVPVAPTRPVSRGPRVAPPSAAMGGGSVVCETAPTRADSTARVQVTRDSAPPASVAASQAVHDCSVPPSLGGLNSVHDRAVSAHRRAPSVTRPVPFTFATAARVNERALHVAPAASASDERTASAPSSFPLGTASVSTEVAPHGVTTAAAMPTLATSCAPAVPSSSSGGAAAVAAAAVASFRARARAFAAAAKLGAGAAARTSTSPGRRVLPHPAAFASVPPAANVQLLAAEHAPATMDKPVSRVGRVLASGARRIPVTSSDSTPTDGVTRCNVVAPSASLPSSAMRAGSAARGRTPALPPTLTTAARHATSSMETENMVPLSIVRPKSTAPRARSPAPASASFGVAGL